MTSRAFDIALCSFDFLRDAELVIAPENPDADMVSFGANAGGVDAATARKIYNAMIAWTKENPLG